MKKFPPRPSVTDDMVREAARPYAEELDIDLSDIVSAYSHPMDGYELAVELIRNHGCDIERPAMEQLDGLGDELSKQHRELTVEWVKGLDQTLILPAGVRVYCPAHDGNGTVEGFAGTTRPGSYLIKPDSDPVESRRWVVRFEDVEVLP